MNNGVQPSLSPMDEAQLTPVGLGLGIEITEEGCTVISTVTGGGAHSCGKISTGDLLIAVLDRARSTNFVSTAGMDLNQVRGMILGAPDSKVSLKMQKSRTNGGDVYLCEDLVRGTKIDMQYSPPPKSASAPSPISSPIAVRARPMPS